MMLSTTAILTILAAALAHWLVGTVWFSAFSRQYVKGLGKTKAQMNKGPALWQAGILHIIGGIAMAFVLRWFITIMLAHGIWGGMQVASVVWLGFIASVLGPMYAYQAFSLRFFMINAGYHLVGILVMGAILGMWA